MLGLEVTNITSMEILWHNIVLIVEWIFDVLFQLINQVRLIFTKAFKEATKLNFIRFPYGFIILVNTDLYKSAFSTYSFKRLIFPRSVFRISCLLCFEFDVIFVKCRYNICVIIVYKVTSVLWFWFQQGSFILPSFVILREKTKANDCREKFIFQLEL